MLSAAHTWSLTAIAAVAGVALHWVWKRFTNQERVALARRQTRARLYAMRLYAAEPALVFRAQRELLRWTGRYLAQMARPTAVAIVPLFVLFLQLDNIYGHRPPAPGESLIVTAGFSGLEARHAPDATLEGRGVAVETPGVRISGGQVCWRVRMTRSLKPGPPGVWLRVGGAAVAQAVDCGQGLRYPSIARWAIARGVGSPWIEVSCPAAELDVFGFGIDWVIWFGVVSVATMLALRRASPGGSA